jgi:hypothetical protein
MKMTHDDFVFASFREQNSRTRSPVRFTVSHRKTPGICECTRTISDAQQKICVPEQQNKKSGKYGRRKQPQQSSYLFE